MKILFKLIFNRDIVTAMLEYNYFDCCFQVLFVNVTVLNIIVNINAS